MLLLLLVTIAFAVKPTSCTAVLPVINVKPPILGAVIVVSSYPNIYANAAALVFIVVVFTVNGLPLAK